MIHPANQSPEFPSSHAQVTPKSPELSQIDQKVASLEPNITKTSGQKTPGLIPTAVWQTHVLSKLTISELFCIARVSKTDLEQVYAKLQVDYPFLLPKDEPNVVVAVSKAKDLYKEIVVESKNALVQAVRKNDGFRDFMTLEGILKSEKIGTISRLDIDNKSDKPIFIPAEIGKFTSLERMVASGCRLIGIAPQIGKCQKLIYIDVSTNQLLSSLPSTLELCQSLMSLDIGECGFFQVPPCVFTLPKLKTLNVAHNNLAEISGDIGKCTELNYLHIEGTQIVGMPDSLSNCKALKQISANDVETLDADFVQDFYNLLQINKKIAFS